MIWDLDSAVFISGKSVFFAIWTTPTRINPRCRHIYASQCRNKSKQQGWIQILKSWSFSPIGRDRVFWYCVVCVYNRPVHIPLELCNHFLIITSSSATHLFVWWSQVIFISFLWYIICYLKNIFSCYRSLKAFRWKKALAKKLYII